MKGEGKGGTFCSFKLKRVKHDFSINKAMLVKMWKVKHPHVAKKLTWNDFFLSTWFDFICSN